MLVLTCPIAIMMKCAVIPVSGVMRMMVDIYGSVQEGEDKTEDEMTATAVGIIIGVIIVVVAEVAQRTVIVVVAVVAQRIVIVVEQMDGT